jgi:hypothetical protein
VAADSTARRIAASHGEGLPTFRKTTPFERVFAAAKKAAGVV